MSNQNSLQEVQNRLVKLGFYCPRPPITHAISAPLYGLICMPMHYVAAALTIKSDEESEESLIEDLFGVQNIRESFAIGSEISELPVSDVDALNLRKLLVNRRSVDEIIYEYAIETLAMFFDVANKDVVELAKTLVARTIVSVAQASGQGWFASGSKASPEQNLAIQSICTKLNLNHSPTAMTVLDQLEISPWTNASADSKG